MTCNCWLYQEVILNKLAEKKTAGRVLDDPNYVTSPFLQLNFLHRSKFIKL